VSDPVDRVLAKLPDARKSGAGWQARCPAHEDNRASLSIARGDDGRALLHCHTGCGPDAIMAALGMTLADLMVPKDRSTSTSGRRQPIAMYPYKDESGALLYEVVRYEPKGFSQRRPEGARGYVYNLADVRRVIFRLDVLHATRPEAVFVVEGEKDVQALERLGLHATTNSGGASKSGETPKWTADHARQLAACGVRRVCVVPDNDDAGRAHAGHVAAACHAVSIEARIVTLPGLPEKGDLCDWLAGGGTKDTLKALAKAAPVWRPTAVDPSALGTPVLLRMSDIAPERIDWIWPGRLARGKKSMLAADPGVGKSTLSVDIAARITRGAAWPDGGRAPLGSVLMLCAEDGLADTVRPRIDGAGGDASRVYVLDGVKDERGSTRMVSLARDLAALEAALEQVRPELVVIDPITAYLGKADSYKDAEVRGLLAPVLALLPRYGAALLTIAHLSKDQQRAALHRPANSIAFIAAARMAFALATDPNDDTRCILATLKSNVCAKAPSLAFRLVDVNPSVTDSPARIEWESAAVVMDAEALLRKPSPQDRADRVDAEEVLRELLADGPLDSKAVFTHAKAAGISDRQLKDAKASLGIKPKRIGGLGASGRWIWALPYPAMEPDAKTDDAPANTSACPPVLLSPLSENTPLRSSPPLRRSIYWKRTP
jgi:putative DNA primase/helicase